ncbi:hypothetical protein [Vibrio crassostreae]|uniref:hypothetical protein n=1 Tax=Vibrio crassostreae TaxID=246167 RepID=UPI001B309870|nr:hypothetical protein [Vibrio crassostreae]
MLSKTSLLVIINGLGLYIIYSNFYSTTHNFSDTHDSIVQDTTPIVRESSHQTKTLPVRAIESFNSTQTSVPNEKIDSIPPNSLEELHLKEFSEYLNGERASEHTILAFYTDSRWSEFYEREGYRPEDIEQLINFRSQYLADISQSRKEYYYYRWANAPHEVLSNMIAEIVIANLGNGENRAAILSNSILEVSNSYGVSTSLAKRIVKGHLLDAISYIESSSALSSIEPQIEVVDFDSDFKNYLKHQAGYTQNTIVINTMPGINSSSR